MQIYNLKLFPAVQLLSRANLFRHHKKYQDGIWILRSVPLALFFFTMSLECTEYSKKIWKILSGKMVTYILKQAEYLHDESFVIIILFLSDLLKTYTTSSCVSDTRDKTV